MYGISRNARSSASATTPAATSAADDELANGRKTLTSEKANVSGEQDLDSGPFSRRKKCDFNVRRCLEVLGLDRLSLMSTSGLGLKLRRLSHEILVCLHHCLYVVNVSL